MANLLSTTVSGALSASGRISVTYNTDRYQFNFNRTSASDWWVTNDSTALGLHVNNVGDKFYFSTAGDFYSDTNGWLSTALAAKQNASTAITTSNIGSQSVNYATSAGNSDTVDSLHASSFVRNDTTRQYLKPYFEYSEYLTTQSPLDLVNQMGGGGFRVDFLHPSYTANGNWGHVMTWSGYNGYTMYQMSGSYGAGSDVELYVRNEANHGRDAWSSWRRLLHDNNYNSYSPTLTGTGASGTWGISITGNATTATTAGALSSMNISQFSNNSGYITSSASITGNAASATFARRIAGPERIGFNVGGDPGMFYPIAISTGAGSTDSQYSEFIIERGGYEDPGYTGIAFSTFNARFTYKPSGWGYGAVYFNLEQLTQTATMLGDYLDQYQSTQAIIWLRGATRYNIYSVYGGIGLIFTNEGGTSYSMAYGTYDPISTPREKATTAKYYDSTVRYAGTIYTGSNAVIHAGNIGSQSVSYATTAGSAPNGSNLNASYGVTAGAGNGLKFWGGDDTYKISMGNSDEYHYGPVTDYSIKTVIDSVGATRGFTWGVNGGTPIAALNVGNGNMQIAGTFTASNFSGSSSGTNTGDQTNISGNAATATNAVAASNLSLTSLGTASVNVNNGSSAVYRNENGSGGNLSYAPVLHLGASDTMWQIQGDYYDSSTLRWRAGYSGTWYAWRDIIHSGNIASQSVASATDASTLGGFGRGNTTNKVAYFDGTRNLYVNNPETYTGEVRLGAAWNRGGVYASNTLTMSTSSGAIDFVSNDTILGGFRWASTTGSRFIVGEGVTTTPYTLIDTNKRPVIYARGPYPVLTLDHTETSNGEHGPTIQFVFNGSNARQWVIGCGGTGNHMDFGFSSSGYGNTNYNPHNGISGYQGNTIMRIIDSRVGIGGDWGAYGSVANPEHTLDVRGTIFSNTDMRAPIFYDSQDTAYYVDPNRTGTSLIIALGIVTTSPGGSVLLKHAVSEVDAWLFQENAANWGLYWKNNPSGNHTFGGYTTIGAELFGMSATNSSGNGVLTTNFVGATAAYAQYMLSNFTGYIWSASTIFAAGDMRAPIFYDSQNTGYYGDFASTSVMNAIRLGTSTNNGTISGGGEWGMRLTTDSGYIQFGPANSSWAHIYSGMPFYFNQELYVNGTQVVKNSGTWSINISGNAASASSVAWGNVSSKPAGWLDTTNLIQSREPNSILQSGFYESYLGSGNPTGTWFNYINVRHSNPDNGHGYQIGMSYYDNNLWFRSYQGAIAATFQAWSRALGTNTDPYPSNMDQYVRTSDSVSFLGTTSPTILVNGHSDNTKGYRIHNTSGSSVSAMFTNSSNQLVIAAGAVDQINLNKKVYVNGVALGVNIAPSATAGRIDASNDIVAYSSSDERLKENITPIANALDKVKSLTGVEFDWKPEYKGAHGHEGHDTGIIAQQVLSVMPTAVRTNDTGYLAVRYEKLIGLLIEGMKEQQSQIEELKAKLDGLTK